MTENEIKEYIADLRNKADVLRKSGFATNGVSNHFDKSADVIEELLSYRAIGTIEEFKDLKEKNEPEKPLFVPTDDTCLYQEYRCPSCNEWLADKFKPYRCKCGQKLDWE